ncbi:hypothetical protein BO71DRAFT_399044 [Aspergillus ellipticus CBS 707.79]|uniref:Uncharacterized protein n=1 Tax=Aspergillus ellipticus CBS 707.79 TaxID=1448320 RepID=A0A319DJK1_9EURO|nr:hypothetical protein BO71DRAFT_399044 [Aspergillus ellipticus CBS 707.79]
MPEASLRVWTTLERLPVEIIQQVFLHCLEFNLPRASIHLARALSYPILYTWIIRLAFSSPIKPSGQPFFTRDFLPEPLDFFSVPPQQRRDLQRAVLDCRWCTLPLMRRCQREYVEHAIRRRCGDLEFSPSDYQTLLGNRVRPNVTGWWLGPQGQRQSEDLILEATVRGSNAKFQVQAWPNYGAFKVFRSAGQLYDDSDIYQLPYGTKLPTRMPDKLLCPPWTESKMGFLKLLAPGAYIDEERDHPRSGRVLRQLIRDRDFTTFKQLVDMHIRVKWSKYPIEWPILKNHYLVALKYADERNDPFVKLLVDMRWGEIPADDVKLKDKLMANMTTNSLE